MDEFTTIAIGNIIITKDNPRQEFKEEPLRQLGESIKTHGLLQPIVVRPKNGYFELVVGERRLRAAQLIGLTEIEAKIQDIDDATCMELRLIENTHREDLTDAEKGDAVYTLIEKYPEKYPSIKSVAEATSASYTIVKDQWCAKSRRLSPEVNRHIIDHVLPETHGLLILKYDHSTQNKLAKAMVKHKLTQRQVREFLKRYDAEPTANLDDLAEEAMGIKKVEIDVEKLTPEARREVEEIIEEKKELMEKVRKESIEKARKAPRRKPQRKKTRLEPTPELTTVPDVSIKEEVTTPKVEVPSPEVEKVPERPETKGVVLTALVPTDLFSKVTSLTAERRATLGETVVYIIEQFFKLRERYGD